MEKTLDKKELLASSPVRFFEPTGASLDEGEIGLLTAKKGLGKTSILVQFGIDTLLKDKAIVHVSFNQKSENVITWYSSVLAEICKSHRVDVDELSDELFRNRTILNFNQDTFTLPKVVNTLKALKDNGIKLETIIVDDLDLLKTEVSDLNCFCDFIKEEKMTAWFSYNSEASDLNQILPSEKMAKFNFVAHLLPETESVSLSILKKGEGKVKLNSKTLLMTK